MCQPANKGGKRCLRHSAASNAEVRFTFAKTNATHDTIYGILKQLNKEGRKMDTPELAEVNAFLDKEEFKVKLDPDLTERDRKLILKNLEKARQEAQKQGVTAGAFHAWKNVFKKTVETMKRPLLAIGIAGTIGLALAGCTGGTANMQHTAEPTSTSSSAPTNLTACGTANAGPFGDVIAKKEVTDKYGEYCQTTIDPTSSALKYDASKTDMASLKQYGFTEDDAKAAQKSAVTFLAEQELDSTILDNTTESQADWFNANKSYYNSSASTYSEFQSAAKDGKLGADGVVVTGYSLPVFPRTGAPRAQQTNLAVTSIVADKDNTGKAVLVVNTSATVVYKAKEADIVKTIIANNPSETTASLQASNPELFAKNDQNNLLLTGSFKYGFYKGSDKIAGQYSSWKINTGTGLAVIK